MCCCLLLCATTGSAGARASIIRRRGYIPADGAPVANYVGENCSLLVFVVFGYDGFGYAGCAGLYYSP